eukprot:3343958-Pleurochrysis_carterae.AAC.2
MPPSPEKTTHTRLVMTAAMSKLTSARERHACVPKAQDHVLAASAKECGPSAKARITYACGMSVSIHSFKAFLATTCASLLTKPARARSILARTSKSFSQPSELLRPELVPLSPHSRLCAAEVVSGQPD